MYDTILIPTDGSIEGESGARHGVDLAAALGSTVHALYVIEEGGNPWLAESMDDQMERARAHGEEITAEVAAMAADAGVECVTATRVGPAVFEKVNDYVEENAIDAIAMGTGYRGSVGGLLGSTAEKVVRTAAVPVTTVRRG